MLGISVGMWPMLRQEGGALAASLNRNVSVMFIGDSTSVGVGADPSGITDVNGSRPFSVPLKAKDWLNVNGVAAIAETVAADNNVGLSILPSYRSDITMSGTFASSSRTPTAGGTLIRHGAGTALHFTTSVPVDSFKFAYPRVSGFGSLQVSVDGVAHSTYIETITPEDYTIATVTGLSLAPHKISFSVASGTPHGPGYIHAWDSTKKTVQIINAGTRNWTTANWGLAAYPGSPKNALSTLAPDITVIDLGINDYRQAGTTIATCTTNLQALINKVTAAGAKVILVVPNPIASYNTTTDAWSQAAVLLMYQNLAAANPNATLIDAPAVYAAAGFGASNPATYASLNAVGLMYDTFHPNAPIYAAEGDALGAAIKSICASNGWLA